MQKNVGVPTAQTNTISEPRGYGFVQYIMTSASVLVSGLESVGFRLAFEKTSDSVFVGETWEFRINPISDALSSTLSFSYNNVLPSVTEEIVIQEREVGSFIFNEDDTAQAAFQIVMTIYQGDSAIQLMPCFGGGFCDISIFDSFP